MAKLTNKQSSFVVEYLVDLNATQAATRAGYSEKTAKAIGHENLTKPDIAAAIHEAMAGRSEQTAITAEYVLTTIRDTVEGAKSDGERAIVLRGAELLGKHLNLFSDKSSQISLPIVRIINLTGEGPQ